MKIRLLHGTASHGLTAHDHLATYRSGPTLAYDAIHQCLLMHGHGGYDRGPMEQRLRDVLGFQIGDGTAQIMKTIIARTRAGRAAVGA